MLGRNYRFTYLNSVGQTVAASSIVTTCRRWNFSSSGVQTWEGAEATLDSTLAALASGSYSNGGAVDNSTNAYLGGTFKFKVTFPLSSSGTFTIYLQQSTDAGSTFPDNGNGMVVKVYNVTTSGTLIDEIEI